MCAQCMAGAAVAAAGATGVRAWLGVRRPSWLGDRGLRAAGVVLAIGAIVGAGLIGTGS